MNPKLASKLLNTYLELYSEHDRPPSESLMCFGFEVGDGWFNIIDTLSRSILFHIKSEIDHEIFLRENRCFRRIFVGLRHSWNTWNWYKYVWRNIKEYIRLRCPLDIDSMQVHAVQVKEKFGGLRFYVSGGDNEVYGMITMAEAMSYVICEDCGKPGALHHRGGWLKTVCTECALKLEYIKGPDEI